MLQSSGDSEDVKPALKKLQSDKGKGKAVDKEDKKEEKVIPVNIHSLDITPSTKMKRLWCVYLRATEGAVADAHVARSSRRS